MSNTSLDKTFFDSIDSEEKAYWVGFLMADAGISKHGNIKLELASKDADHVSLFSETVGSGYKVTDRLCSRGHPQRSTTIYSKYMCNALANLGITTRKSESASPPEIDQLLVRHMVRGLVDGDGWIYQGKNKNTVQIGLCGSFGCCEFFSKWVSNLFGYEPSVRKRGNVHNCVISKSGVSLAVLSELYCSSSVHLNRKRDKAFRIWVEA